MPLPAQQFITETTKGKSTPSNIKDEEQQRNEELLGDDLNL